MPTQTFDRECIALTQLETALRLFFESEDYFSVITLAGAADEIFGKMLSARGIENSLESTKNAVAAIHLKLYGEDLAEKDIIERANRAKNALKHFDKNNTPTITFNAKEEAIDMLNRAIDNYWSLKEWLTPSMERFQRESFEV
ncbi:MAG: hypothetical protein ACE5EN_11285 [Nitrospinota bacterium]